MCCVITAVLAFIVWLCPGALARMFSNDPVGAALESRSHPYSRGCLTWMQTPPLYRCMLYSNNNDTRRVVVNEAPQLER